MRYWLQPALVAARHAPPMPDGRVFSPVLLVQMRLINDLERGPPIVVDNHIRRRGQRARGFLADWCKCVTSDQVNAGS